MSRWWDDDVRLAYRRNVNANFVLDMATAPDNVVALTQVPNLSGTPQQMQQAEPKNDSGEGLWGWINDKIVQPIDNNVIDPVKGAVFAPADRFLGQNVPGWNLAQEALEETIMYPLEMVASAWRWTYNEAFSQPLSTLLLQIGKFGTGDLDAPISWDDWKSSYKTANSMSPAQVATNMNLTFAPGGAAGGIDKFISGIPVVNVITAAAKGFAAGITPMDPGEYTPAMVRKIEEQGGSAEDLITATELWRGEYGSYYTWMSGASDFALNFIGDPFKIVMKPLRAIRATKANTIGMGGMTEPQVITAFGNPIFSIGGRDVTVVRNPFLVSRGYPSTQEIRAPFGVGEPRSVRDIMQSAEGTKFLNWAQGKSSAEILQHPMFKGMRRQPGAYQMASILSSMTATPGGMRKLRDTMMLFGGDVAAYRRLARDDFEVASKLGKYMDNRIVLGAEANIMSKVETRAAQKVEAAQRLNVMPPTLRSRTEAQRRIEAGREPSPRYLRQVRRYEARSGFKSLFVKEAVDRQKFIAMSNENLNARINVLDTEIQALAEKSDFYRRIFGAESGKPLIAKEAEEAKVAAATLFGNLNRIPLSDKTLRVADRRIKVMSTDRVAREATGGLAMRLIQRGVLGPTVRVITSFGDRAPRGWINLNLPEEGTRLLDMLKRVPGLGQEQRLNMMRRYDAATDKGTRRAALERINQDVINHMVRRHGLSDYDARQLWGVYSRGKEEVLGGLASRSDDVGSNTFSAAVREIKSGNATVSRRVDLYDDGEGLVASPLFKTQLEYQTPLLNVKEWDRILSRNASKIKVMRQGAGKTADLSKEFAETFNYLWKPFILISPRYIPRMVSDEILAKGAKLGAHAIFMDAGRGTKNWMYNRIYTSKDAVDRFNYRMTRAVYSDVNREYASALRETENAKAALEGYLRRTDRPSTPPGAGPIRQPRDRDWERARLENDVEELELRSDGLADNLQEMEAYLKTLHKKAEPRARRRIGTEIREVEGQEVPGPFSEVWPYPIAREEVTSHDFYQKLMARSESMIREDLSRTGKYVTIAPDETGHMEAWLRSVNLQIRQDPVANAILRDPTGQQAFRYLASNEGKAHLKELGPHGFNPDDLVENISIMIDQYVPESLRQTLARRPVKEKELRKAGEGNFPVVHGDELAAHMGTNRGMARIGRILDKTYNAIASTPSDILSRHPTYVRLHNGHMDTLIRRELEVREAIGGDEFISLEDMNALMQKSHKLALSDLQQVVYDPGNMTNATMALRNIAPFVGAHLDSIRRWTGLIAEKPELVGTVSRIYNAPTSAGLVTDGRGHVVGEDGYVEYVNAEGKTVREFVPQRNRQIVFQLPKPLQKFFPTVTGDVRIPLASINTVLPGDPWWNPGAGPLVAIPVGEYLRENPSDSAMMRWILPFGASREETFLGRVTSQITPSYIRNLRIAFDEDNSQFVSTMQEVMLNELARYHRGERDTPPNWNDVADRARNMWMMKAFSSFVYPVAMGPDNPMRFFSDQLLKMRIAYPEDGDIRFMQKYGEDAFLYAAALTKNNTGVKATINAVNKSKELQDVIARFPEFGGLIVGPEGDGPFSQSAYTYQLTHQIGPGDTRKQREVLSPQEAIEDAAKQAGWAKFRYVMRAIDAEMYDRGETSLQGKNTRDLLAKKRALISAISQQNPVWYQDFSQFDRSAVPRRVNDLRTITQIPSLYNNPIRSDIRMLAYYLQLRDQFQAELVRRDNAGGSSTLTAQSNESLRKQWFKLVGVLKEKDTRFGDLYNRYLQNDVLQFGPGV